MPKRALLPLAALLCCAAAAAPQVHLNQLGYLPSGPKRAIVASAARAPIGWRVLDAGGRTVASGKTRVVGDDAASGDHVHQIDLSPIRAAGEFRLAVEGAVEQRFTVAPRLYRPLARASLNFFYQQRAGTPILTEHAGGAQWARAAGHPREVAPCFEGKDTRGTDWAGCGYTIDVTGGWYDAGDHGKYVVNGGIALWTLLNLAETSAAFPDGSAALPEAGNGVSDLLDEARYELDFLLRMQMPEGTRMALPVGRQGRAGPLTLTPADVGGMAHHKVADRSWTKLPTIPAEDREPRLLYPPSTAATLNLAAVAAQGARLWRTVDPAFAARCRAAAERAFAAALRNPEVYAATAFDGSGGYGDASLDDEFFWAGAELYATTGDASLLARLKASPLWGRPLATEPSWNGVDALGFAALATAAGVDRAVAGEAGSRLIALADNFVAERDRTGYAIPYATLRYPWGSTGAILNRAMILGLAHKLTGDAKYREAAVDAADYILGRNPLGQSYVSGFGTRPLRNPHHRFWAKSLDARLPGPPPGALSGGPNNTSFVDPVAKTLEGKCAPQRCWRDDINAYALNEVAINWNAPLVWVAAWLDATEPGGG